MTKEEKKNSGTTRAKERWANNKELMRSYKRKSVAKHRDGVREYSKKWKLEHPNYFMQYARQWRKKNPDREAMYKIVHSKIPLKDKCEICGEPAVDRHHEDYSKPLEVIHLCEACHAKKHTVRKIS